MQQHKHTDSGHQPAKRPVAAGLGNRAHSTNTEDGILTLQRAAGNQAVNGLLGNGSTSSGGRSLDPGVQSFMEERFSADFSSVRVHTDEQAASATRAVGATAFTDGREIHFAAGQYQPDTAPGRQLLAHELAHVVQTDGRMPSNHSIAPGQDSWEGQARQAADSIHSDAPIHVSTGAPAAIRMQRAPNLAAVLARIESLPATASVDDLLWVVAEANINISDRDNLNPIVSAIANRFPQEVMFQFLNRVEELVPQRRRAPTAAELAQHQRTIRLMQVGRRGPYGQYGLGVALPVISNLARPLLEIYEALENAFESAGSFVRGLCEGVSQSISPAQARDLADRLLESSILNLVFPPVFLSGAAVGILEDVVDVIRGLYHVAVNIADIASAAMELIGVFFSEEGPRVAKQMGVAIGESYAQKILSLLKGGIFRFTFDLGRLVGPTIVYTVLAFLGIPGLLAASVAGRIFTVLQPLLTRFPRLLRLARSLAGRLPQRRTRPGRHGGDQPEGRQAPAQAEGQPRAAPETDQPAGGRRRRASTRGFLNDALRRVSNPNHPLHFLVVGRPGPGGQITYGWRTTTRTTRRGRRQTGRYEGNEEGPVVQVGHQGAFASGSREQFMLEDADLNQLGGRTIESRGAYSFKDAVVIEGVPVDVASAQQWERLGRLRPGTVSASPRIAAPSP